MHKSIHRRHRTTLIISMLNASTVKTLLPVGCFAWHGSFLGLWPVYRLAVCSAWHLLREKGFTHNCYTNSTWAIGYQSLTSPFFKTVDQDHFGEINAILAFITNSLSHRLPRSLWGNFCYSSIYHQFSLSHRLPVPSHVSYLVPRTSYRQLLQT